MKFYAYILRSRKTDRFYIGSTSDLIDRLQRHNGGRSLYTRSGIPWELAYSEEFESRSEAVRREKQLKSWKNRERLEELIKSGG
ncbi:MAG: GIY-YIG nuclease family protein [candidate division Zixibacteria bacterium]|nr:GIY-YIG nuclease family protein [candidate division Zixibacteria bacterium]